jgi:hypothetical protein
LVAFAIERAQNDKLQKSAQSFGILELGAG